MHAKSEIDAEIGRKIRFFRKEKKITQRQLATKLNISHQQLQKYETGENKISASRFYSVCLLLKVGINDFFLEKDELQEKKILQNLDRKSVV